MSDRINFEINGKTVTAYPNETIWQIANRLKIDIPHLCYLPEKSYRPDGNCRACMIEITGERVLAASCIRKPEEGMVVKTKSDRAKKSANVRWFADRLPTISTVRRLGEVTDLDAWH